MTVQRPRRDRTERDRARLGHATNARAVVRTSRDAGAVPGAATGPCSGSAARVTIGPLVGLLAQWAIPLPLPPPPTIGAVLPPPGVDAFGRQRSPIGTAGQAAAPAERREKPTPDGTEAPAGGCYPIRCRSRGAPGRRRPASPGTSRYGSVRCRSRTDSA